MSRVSFYRFIYCRGYFLDEFPVKGGIIIAFHELENLIITALQRNVQMRAENILFIKKMQQLIGDFSGLNGAQTDPGISGLIDYDVGRTDLLYSLKLSAPLLFYPLPCSTHTPALNAINSNSKSKRYLCWQRRRLPQSAATDPRRLLLAASISSLI